MQEAFEETPPEQLVFLVLTLDAPLHDLRHNDLGSLYKELGKRLEKFRKRLRRLMRTRLGVDPFGKSWVAVVEQHASGVPHVNVLMRAPEWARWLSDRYASKRIAGLSTRNARLLAGTNQHRDETDALFLDLLNACGFGYRSSAEVARNTEAAIGYIGKVAGHADHTASRVARRLAREQGLAAVGEASKGSQLPIRAPKGFRRLRSGVHFLPPRRKGDKTGMIVKRYRTSEGDEIARPLVVTQRPDLLAMQDAVCETEQLLAWKDESQAARTRRLKELRQPTRVSRREQITTHRIDPSRRSQPVVVTAPGFFARAGPGPPSSTAQPDLPGVCEREQALKCDAVVAQPCPLSVDR
jgi:hypothetical protein